MAYDNEFLSRCGCGAPDCSPAEKAAGAVVKALEIAACVAVIVGGFLFCWWWGG